MERRVAPPRRTARPFASLARSCSAPRSCHPGLVQAVVGPAQCGCAKHACCHFARDAASPRPHAWRAGAASAGRKIAHTPTPAANSKEAYGSFEIRLPRMLRSKAFRDGTPSRPTLPSCVGEVGDSGHMQARGERSWPGFERSEAMRSVYAFLRQR